MPNDFNKTISVPQDARVLSVCKLVAVSGNALFKSYLLQHISLCMTLSNVFRKTTKQTSCFCGAVEHTIQSYVNYIFESKNNTDISIFTLPKTPD